MRTGMLLLLLLFSVSASAESVKVLAISGGRALVNVNNNTEITMKRGVQVDGVRLLDIRGGVVEFSILGDFHRLLVGQSAIVTTSTFMASHNLESDGVVVRKSREQGTVKEYSIPADRRGRYYVMGMINGVPVRFQVDTGADFVAMSHQSGVRVGLPFTNGLKGLSRTASGTMISFHGACREVTVGNIRLENVLCSVSEKPDNGALNEAALLGNSFLRRLKMRQENGFLTLIQEL